MPDRAVAGACLAVLLSSSALAAAKPAAKPADSRSTLQVLSEIRDEGFRRSQVMATARHLTDEIGARLTASPGMHAASAWTRDQLAAWGLANARLESFTFGEGWSFSHCAVRMTTPDDAVLFGIPKAWSPATDGVVRGRALRLEIEEESDLDEHQGKLAGTILFLGEEPEPLDFEKDLFHRRTAADLDALAEYDVPPERERGAWREKARKRWRLWQGSLWERLAQEGVVAVVEPSSFDFGAVRLTGGGNYGNPDAKVGLPQIVLGREHYMRVVRLLEEDPERPVELEIEVAATFHRDDPTTANTLAELPGSDLAHEVVTIGAHLDSWHAGTGATDNGGSSAVVMEAMRILQAVGARPRRTIRVALWSGEEQGLLGSKHHVATHYATRPDSDDPEQADLPRTLRDEGWPITPKPEHGTFSVYFNIDNGGGRVRGIYAQENLAAKGVLERFIAPLADLGVTTVTMETTGSTDHISFDRVGLPGFQVIQDERDYSTRTHHSHLDTFEYLEREDLMQAAVVMASLAYQAAVEPERMPRKPLPTEPPNEEKDRAKAQDAVKETAASPAVDPAIQR